MSDDPSVTRKIVRLDPNTYTTWCKELHDLQEIELTRIPDRKVRAGDCPSCARRYVSDIIGFGWEK